MEYFLGEKNFFFRQTLSGTSQMKNLVHVKSSLDWLLPSKMSLVKLCQLESQVHKFACKKKTKRQQAFSLEEVQFYTEKPPWEWNARKDAAWLTVSPELGQRPAVANPELNQVSWFAADEIKHSSSQGNKDKMRESL